MDNDEITRRDFVTMTVAAGIVATTGAQGSAQPQVVETNIEIKTADGTCDADPLGSATARTVVDQCPGRHAKPLSGSQCVEVEV